MEEDWDDDVCDLQTLDGG